MALTTQQIQNAYVAFFNRPADWAGLQHWSTYAGSTGDLLNTFAESAEYKALYAGLNSTQLVNQVYLNLFGRAPEPKGLKFWVDLLDQGRLSIGNIADAINKGAQGTDKTIIENKTAAAVAFTDALDTTAKIVAYAGVNATGLQAVKTWLNTLNDSTKTVASITGTDLTTLLSTVQNNVASTGQTFTLTTGVDNITGTSGNDTITASNADLTTGDTINGGAGTDTLNVTIATAAQPIVTLNSVENVNITAGVVTNVAAVNAGNWTGVESLKLKGLGSNLTAANGTAGWNFTGLQNNVKIGLENVTVGAGGDDAIRVVFADNKLASTTATLALDVNNAGTVGGNRADIAVEVGGTDAITKLTVNATGKNNVGLQKVATAASLKPTELTVTGAGDLTFALDGTNAVFNDLTTVNAGAATGALTTDVSASTKAVTFTGSAGKNNITFGNGDNVITGGAAADTFTLGTGKNTVTGGAGNDTVIGAVADFTKDDKIDLGEGARDALVYNDVTNLSAGGVTAAQLAALNGYTGIEVIGSSGAVTNIDAAYFTQTVYRLTGTLSKDVTMTNVAGDTLELHSGITANTNDALTVSGSLPNQTFSLELNGGASLTLTGKDGAAGDAALTIASGISTVNILSTTSATSTTGLVNKLTNTGVTTADYVVDNVSAGSFVLTGNVDFTIDNGKTAGFSKAVDFNASAFTGKLNIVASSSADVIKGGSGNDTIRAGGGNDVIDLTAGGKDTVVFEATAAGNGKDTITGFNVGNGNDVLDVVGTVTALTTVTSLTGGATLGGTNAVTIVNLGTAIAGKVFGGSGAADFGDLFGATKVFATGTASTTTVLVVQGTDQTQILYVTNDATAGVIDTEVAVVGVLTDVTNAATFHATNFA